MIFTKLCNKIAIQDEGGITLERVSLLESFEELVDHITFIEEHLQLDRKKEWITFEIKELKTTVLGLIDKLVCE